MRFGAVEVTMVAIGFMALMISWLGRDRVRIDAAKMIAESRSFHARMPYR
jgi:hypothetical protein